jgi:hypothetical protein
MDVLEGLRRLLAKHGKEYSLEDLESYAGAGWSLKLSGGDR